MPPLKPVASLKTCGCNALVRVISSALVTMTRGEKPFLENNGWKMSGIVETVRRRTGRGKKHNAATHVDYGPHCLPKVEQYLGQCVPKDKREDLLHQVLLFCLTVMTTDVGRSPQEIHFCTEVQQLGVCLSMALRLLLDEVTCLDMTPLIHNGLKWVSTCKLNNRNPKQASQIDPVKMEQLMLKILGDNAAKLVTLLSLRCPHVVSGELVRLVGQHCPDLRVLVMACQCEVNTGINEVKEDPTFARKEREFSRSLVALYSRTPGDFTGAKSAHGCPKLRKLVLPRTDDEDNHVATTLAEALGLLTYLEHVSGVSMLVTIEQMKLQPTLPRVLSLRHLSDIDTYNRRTEPDLVYMKTVMSQVDSIEIVASESITRRVIEAFPRSKQLKIALNNFHLQVRKYTHLECLDVTLDFQPAWPLIHALSRAQTPLVQLTLRHCTFQISPELEHSTPQLPTLTSFHLIQSSFIEFDAFTTIVAGCPMLEELNLALSDDRNYAVDEFNDNLMLTVAPSLQNLKSFVVDCQYKQNLYTQLNCILTMATVDALCQHCPLLTYIGNLDCWDVHDREVRDLASKIKRLNWDLVIP